MKSRHELREAVFRILFQVENTELDFIELLDLEQEEISTSIYVNKTLTEILEKKDEIKFLTIPTFILFLVFDGFRKSSVGGDLNFYVGVFKEHSLQIPELSNIFNSRFEIGYILFNNSLRSITDSYTILLFSFAIITLFIWFYELFILPF